MAVLCLQEGEYEFTIKDMAGDGICCGVTQRYGSYNVTTNGMLIAEGGDFNSSESTSFSLPMLADNACEGITTKKECTKSDSNCEWDTGLCILSNAELCLYPNVTE